MKLALERCAVAARQLCDIFDEHTVYVYDGSLSDFKKPTTGSTTSALRCRRRTFTRRRLRYSLSGSAHANGSTILTRQGSGAGVTVALPRTTKGGVVYDYWVSNPWHGRDSLKVSTADVTPESTMTTAAATRKEARHDNGDAIKGDDSSTEISEHTLTSVGDCSLGDSEDASNPGGDAVAFNDQHNEPGHELPRAAMPDVESSSLNSAQTPTAASAFSHHQGWR